MKKIIATILLGVLLVPGFVSAKTPTAQEKIAILSQIQVLMRELSELKEELRAKQAEVRGVQSEENDDDLPVFVQEQYDRFEDAWSWLKRDVDALDREIKKDKGVHDFTREDDALEFYLDNVVEPTEELNDEIYDLVTQHNDQMARVHNYDDKYDIDFEDYELDIPTISYDHPEDNNITVRCEEFDDIIGATCKLRR